MLGKFINCRDNSVPAVPESYQPARFDKYQGIFINLSQHKGQVYLLMLEAFINCRDNSVPAVPESYQPVRFDKYRSIFINLGQRKARSTCCTANVLLVDSTDCVGVTNPTVV